MPAYGLFALASPLLPVPVAAALAAPSVIVGLLLALGRRDGLNGECFALAAIRFFRAPRRRVLAPEAIPTSLLPTRRGRSALAALDLPVRSVRRSGLVELQDGSCCRLLRAASASFALRSDEEQEALVAAFGRFLNGLVDSVQIVVRSEPVDLQTGSAELLEAASQIANQQLRDAAAGYARFLAELGGDEDVRRREILLVLTSRSGDAESVLERRASEAVELLRPAGVELEPLDGESVAVLLARALDPPGPPPGSRLEGVIRRC